MARWVASLAPSSQARGGGVEASGVQGVRPLAIVFAGVVDASTIGCTLFVPTYVGSTLVPLLAGVGSTCVPVRAGCARGHVGVVARWC